jgi:DNA adenine methylase
MRSTGKKMLPFSWYGGKFSHLQWLLPILDKIPHELYVESCGGSAAVLLNKKPSKVEVYNDINSEVVNFFRVLRNQKDQLIEQLELTPYSREEFADSCDIQTTSDLERARQFFVKARQVRTGLCTVATPGAWAYVKKDGNKNAKALTVSRWLNGIEMLEPIFLRLKEVQIEHLDALEVIKKYDTEHTLHYIDPPYLKETRNKKSIGYCYADDFSDEQHVKLLDLILTLKGKVCISGYWNELYADKLKYWKSHKVEKIASSTNTGEKAYAKEEVLWSNV